MRIIGIDKTRSNDFSGVTSRFFELDDEPKAEWVQYFINIYNQHKSSRKCPAKIVGKWVVVECELTQLQTQIYELNNIFKHADAAFSEWNKQLAFEITERERKEVERKKNAEQVFNNLKFD